jgi:hypothetical protein
MSDAVYSFSISTDTPNARVNSDRLKSELDPNTVAIVPALKDIATVGDDLTVRYAASLSPTEEQTLTDVVAQHSGEPMPDPTTEDGIPKVSIGPVGHAGRQLLETSPRSGSKVQVISQNFCDAHTWYATSLRHTGVVMVDSGDGLTWTLPPGTLTHSPPHNPSVPYGIVDVTHGRLLHERRLRSEYACVVKVDDVVVPEKDPHDNAGAYTINVLTGAVTFDVSQAGKVVTLDVSEVRDSRYYLTPTAGKKLVLISAELQFSADALMEDSFIFQARGDVAKFTPLAPYSTTNGGPYPPGTMLPIGDPTVYQTVLDLIVEANGSRPVIPKIQHPSPMWRDTVSDSYIFTWDYENQASVDISSGPGFDPNDIEISLEHHREMPGSFAIVTFYCRSEDL